MQSVQRQNIPLFSNLNIPVGLSFEKRGIFCYTALTPAYLGNSSFFGGKRGEGASPLQKYLRRPGAAGPPQVFFIIIILLTMT